MQSQAGARRDCGCTASAGQCSDLLANLGPEPTLRSPQAIGVSLSALALVAITTLGTSRGEEREYLRLRPLKEPAPCVNNTSCPLVAAPRIYDHLRS